MPNMQFTSFYDTYFSFDDCSITREQFNSVCVCTRVSTCGFGPPPPPPPSQTPPSPPRPSPAACARPAPRDIFKRRVGKLTRVCTTWTNFLHRRRRRLDRHQSHHHRRRRHERRRRRRHGRRRAASAGPDKSLVSAGPGPLLEFVPCREANNGGGVHWLRFRHRTRG